MDKYYTPDISEFHVGFECECYHKEEKEWYKHTICENDYDMDRYGVYEKTNPFISEYRVKCIDKEDCLSLGLELVIWDNKGGYFKKDNYTIGINLTENFCTISQDDSGNNIMRFFGDLKNKSELKKLMQQLNISNG